MQGSPMGLSPVSVRPMGHVYYKVVVTDSPKRGSLFAPN